ncbi:MAG: hypothetical protein V3T86_06735, partial [Planctomycetota bacterium]
MREHVIVSAAKIGLLLCILLALVFHFIGINETQTKVIETASRVDNLASNVNDLRDSSVEDARDVRTKLDALGRDITAVQERLASGVMVASGGAQNSGSGQNSGAQSKPVAA